MPPGIDSKDQLKARFDRRTATGDRIHITLAARGSFTKLTLRVNTFGERSISNVIIGRIETYLPSTPGTTALPAGDPPVPDDSIGPEFSGASTLPGDPAADTH